MQKNAEITFSKEFINTFKDFLVDYFGYKTYMDMIVVPFLHKKTLMYLPVLSYTDRKHNEVEDLLELAKDNDYQIRTLNFEYQDFKKHDPVTMRLDIENKTAEEIMKTFSTNTRKALKKGLKANFEFCAGNKARHIETFYKMYSTALHNHGTPHYGKDFFYALRDALGDRLKFNCFYVGDEVAGSSCVMYDEEFTMAQWLGINPKFRNSGVGYLIYYREIEESIARGKKILDFGRSGFETGTYEFKRRFRAKPVKIDIYQPKNEDLYSKYSLASDIWKKLPKPIVDFLGPKLTKYLKDL
ncbi:GNAT family N-acetyltransferase [Caminibacter pacificus]